MQSISGQCNQLQSIIETNLPSSRMSFPSTGGRTRTISGSSSTDSTTRPALEPQGSMERGEAGVGTDGDVEEYGNNQGEINGKDSLNTTLTEQQQQALRDEGSCVVS